MKRGAPLGKTVILAVLASGAFTTIHETTSAQAPPYYQGKSVRIIVGFTAGGGYDRWARLIARHMGKYIPGNPTFVVQNMPGAGGLIAANYIYNVAKPDGETLAMTLGSIHLDQLVSRKEVEFDVRRTNWIGSQEKNDLILYMRADTPYKSIADIIKAKEPSKCGAIGTASADYILPKVLEETLGAKFSLVQGYPGGREVDMAVERGEVVCRGMTIASRFSVREPYVSWDKKGFVRNLVQTTTKRDPRAPDTPTLYELMDQYRTAEVSRRVARVILSGGEFGRPMQAPPGVPADRVKVLREAYAKAMKDPELVAEAKKGQLDMEPSSGENLQTLVQEVMDQPPEVIEQVRKILGN
jgi:tripartite-type tricarboxylate transporter receptor subunit TctC